MNSVEYQYAWQQPNWPDWSFSLSLLAEPLAKVSRNQGILLGRLTDVGVLLRDQAKLLALTDEVIQTSAIEGEYFAPESVRSSIARRLGVDIGVLAAVDRKADGAVDMVMDATENCDADLTTSRLFAWHRALFPFGQSGLTAISVGQLRNDAKGPMQVVSGPVQRQRVHFQAPPAEQLKGELDRFLYWFNSENEIHPILKAGIAHMWLLTLHPFDDGNGRIARAIGEMLLARADGSSQRFYSLSAQIQRKRRDYYEILERSQKGGLDITDWLAWFLSSLDAAISNAQRIKVLLRIKFLLFNIVISSLIC